MTGLSVKQLVNDLSSSCGIERGNILIVHSSLKSIGRVSGGPATVIQALLEAIGSSGTLLMPAFSDPQPDGLFYMLDTPSRTGLISERFRMLPGARRSRHPTHSVVAYGVRASDLICGHEHTGPLGPASPFHRAALGGAKVLMIGCDLTRCSLIHVAEALVRVPYLGRVCYPGYDRAITLVDGDGARHTFAPRDVPGDSSGFNIVADVLRNRGEIRGGHLGDARCLMFRGVDALNAAINLLKQDPAALLCGNPHCAICPESRQLIAQCAAAAR